MILNNNNNFKLIKINRIKNLIKISFLIKIDKHNKIINNNKSSKINHKTKTILFLTLNNLNKIFKRVS